MQTPLDPFVPRRHWVCNSIVATMPELFRRRVFLCLLGITCLLVLLICTYQQELWTRKLLTENIFPWASPSNVSAHSADNFSKAVSRLLNVATDEDASKKKKDDLEEGQVMYIGSKCKFIQMSQSAHIAVVQCFRRCYELEKLEYVGHFKSSAHCTFSL